MEKSRYEPMAPEDFKKVKRGEMGLVYSVTSRDMRLLHHGRFREPFYRYVPPCAKRLFVRILNGKTWRGSIRLEFYSPVGDGHC